MERGSDGERERRQGERERWGKGERGRDGERSGEVNGVSGETGEGEERYVRDRKDGRVE